jgi:thiol-disulfide isomerase/thioredoxin/sugar lactone lactonase YvrE
MLRPTLIASLVLGALVLVGFGVFGGGQWMGPRVAQGQEQPMAEPEAKELEHPFPRRIEAAPLDGGREWLNTSGPIDLRDLRGKFVILDFWTYCCINCIHILPELKKLEQKYPNEVVVIGVHSAKFENEKDTDNIRDAILRYEIEHPVVNDADMRIWGNYQVNSWPSLRVVDPNGDLVAAASGELTFEVLDQFIARALPYYKQKGQLDETPLQWNMESLRARHTEPLLFPGKVLADEASNRLFIADSTHNRIVISSLTGELIDVIGDGQVGTKDGDYKTAQFNKPQGMWLHGQTLYVADTENHMLRKVDLASKTVSTIAGTGEQNRNPLWPGMTEALFAAGGGADKLWQGPPKTTALNSPWALLIHKDMLYIAMAGPHQIWAMPLDESGIGPYSGNGREDIVDGKLIPPAPYTAEAEDGTTYAAYAQPSGLASDGEWLYVADSEGASIRAVPFDRSKAVRTVIGTSELPGGRLFVFGDRDGTGLVQMKDPTMARFRDPVVDTTGPLLQHPICVAYADGMLYVADTYNNKIRAVDAKTAKTTTLAGTGEEGLQDEPAQFDEPAGLSVAGDKLFVADTNNHRIRVVELKTGKVSTLEIQGLTPPERKTPMVAAVDAAEIEKSTVQVKDGAVSVQVKLTLPEGYKINPIAPLQYTVKPTEGEPLAQGKIDPPAAEFTIQVPVEGASGETKFRVNLTYFYCQDGKEGLCKFGRTAWEVPVAYSADASTAAVVLTHSAE